MKKIKIKYVKKKEIFPAFGLAYFETKIIYIRDDLPKIAKKFVLAHELYHIKDYENLKSKNKEYKVVLGELKANFFPFLKDPIGGIFTLFLSLNPSRIKFYIDMYITKKTKFEDLGKNIKEK